MNENKMKINSDKTHLIVMTSSQTRARSQSANLVEIKTPLNIIKAQNSEKYLDAEFKTTLSGISI